MKKQRFNHKINWDSIPPEKQRLIDRVQRRFRYHVRTRSNPNGRIVRETCYFCGSSATEAHHGNYEQTFVVVWVCSWHHRAIERNAVAIPDQAVRDYTHVVKTFQKRWVGAICSTMAP